MIIDDIYVDFKTNTFEKKLKRYRNSISFDIFFCQANPQNLFVKTKTVPSTVMINAHYITYKSIIMNHKHNAISTHLLYTRECIINKYARQIIFIFSIYSLRTKDSHFLIIPTYSFVILLFAYELMR